MMQVINVISMMEKKPLLDSNEHNSYVHEDEKQQLLDGEKKTEGDESTAHSWQRWRKDQIIPVLVLVTASLFTVRTLIGDVPCTRV